MRVISASSVETMILSKRCEFRATSIDHAIIGLPQNSRTFLRGMRLLPPRAGTTANVKGLEVIDSISTTCKVRREYQLRGTARRLQVHATSAAILGRDRRAQRPDTGPAGSRVSGIRNANTPGCSVR